MIDQPLWLLVLVLPIGAALVAARRRRARTGWPAHSVQTVHGLPATWRTRSRYVPEMMRGAALTAVVVALSAPSCVRVVVRPVGLDVLYLVDVSQSMRGLDVQPDRLKAAQALVSSVVTARERDRVGLLLFAGDHALVCPLTTDHAAFLSRLAAVEPTASTGTAIGPALLAGLDRVGGGRTRAPVLVVLTDGASNTGEVLPADAARHLSNASVPLIVVRVGRSGVVPMPSEFGVIEVPMDDDGPTLAAMADAAHGRLIDTSGDAADEIADALGALDRLHGTVESRERTTAQGLWSALALSALVGELVSRLWLRRWVF